ncbi:sigma 54-interacting transcriptional regulator [Caldalkalibacillus thermarum TA2.A1]|uniref:Sigma 54-interacting transcriptional regulator n=1 Tax=Caldalkalibacillus thermarum (strain TA2.A1) TaxID=986075 RepID=A0A8X8I806_CALTT|nr:sigma-54-dependent Fis family transcriptional regulator [Caldalkalibacillus thermarum]QZT32669.1 sigma 54-interacting transcriptional regulator [Caldalkalibacillus thermarum TA2.A1]
MKKIFLVGAGSGGTALLKTLQHMESLKVIGVSDRNVNAPGMKEARKYGIPTGTDYTRMISDDVEVIIETTGDESVFHHLRQIKPKHAVVIPGSIARIIMSLIEEKENLIQQLRHHHHELDIILNSTHDGMMAVNKKGIITLFNRAAERIMGLKAEDVLGEPAQDWIPNSRLNIVLQTGQSELHQEQWLNNERRIITNRVPVISEDGEVIGAVAVFRDITDVTTLAEEVLDLKETRSLLEAIINSSEDAISVVDQNGIGLMINPAYTRLTGLKAEDVIGKPADVDISEGESMHMQVLKTKKPVRGVPMKVGKYRKDVVVNVAPIMVDGELKGSVGIIHDISEIKKLTKELDWARRIIRTLEAKYTFEDIIGESEPVRTAIEQAKNAAYTSATVLLRGESGTGKELFAHAIHNASERKFNQFVRVNCAALSEQLLESELFGYEEGAFTGAKQGGKKGLFEEANGGTIFLDEIGEMSLSTQAKLLRVLQEKEIVRVGGTKTIPVDVRIIAATNVNLEEAILQKKFREDLYYRLNVLPIIIPPLRYRDDDIRLLTEHFIAKYNMEYGRHISSVADEVIERLKSYHWPGNVRELENVISRAIIQMRFTEERLELRHLPPLQFDFDDRPEADRPLSLADHALPSNGNILPLDEVVGNFEKKYLQQVLSQCNGNKTKAAQKLKISVRNLYYKLQKHGLH